MTLHAAHSSSGSRPTLRQLVRDGRDVVREALARSQVVAAWDALQERDGHGRATGPLPWTDEALRELERAYHADPSGVGLAHHLAIARHARAWDLELAADPRAADAWRHALASWRVVVGSSEFWAALERTVAAVSLDAPRQIVADLRRDALEHLLDVHVDFIRHYCEQEAPARAASHVEIVRRGDLPPRLKTRLIAKIFSATTGAVPEARATGAYGPALTSVERFLELVPDDLAGLRLFAEVADEWLLTLSYERWDEIVDLATRCNRQVRALVFHPRLHADPLARPPLERLTFEFALRGQSRAAGVVETKDIDVITLAARDAARGALDFALSWARLGCHVAKSDSDLRRLFGACATMLVVLLDAEARELGAHHVDPFGDRDALLRRAAAIDLYRQAARVLEEASRAEPDVAGHQQNLSVVRGRLSALGDLLPSDDSAVVPPPVRVEHDQDHGVHAIDGRETLRSQNPWRGGVLSENPYSRTAFRIARVPRDVVKRRTVISLVAQTRQLIEADAAAHTIGGRAVSTADVNRAESILLDPTRRIQEELLEHAPERLSTSRFTALADEVIRGLAPAEAATSKVTNLDGLSVALPRLVADFLDATPADHPSFGALELTLVPPCGDPSTE